MKRSYLHQKIYVDFFPIIVILYLEVTPSKVTLDEKKENSFAPPASNQIKNKEEYQPNS